MIDDGAEAVSGIRVVLLRAKDGHTEGVAETTTDAGGRYRFDDLYEGAYSVLFELNGEWTFTRYGEDSAVYGALSGSGSTQTIDLHIGEDVEGVDAGVTIPAQLTVNVFKDTQADGVKGAYEENFEGISVTLIHIENGEDAESVTYKTDEEGNVTFAASAPASMRLPISCRASGAQRGRFLPQAARSPVTCRRRRFPPAEAGCLP